MGRSVYFIKMHGSPGTVTGLLDPGHIMDRYEIISPIGSGGMATVYLGRARGPGGFSRLVAIKVCHDHLRDEQRFVEMFLDEARLAAKIHHPNVVSTLDVCDKEHLYLVMEYVKGGSLSSLLRATKERKRLLSVPLVVRVIYDALLGLHAAHELADKNERPLNIIHRDVSPQNILIGTDGVARISDFGIARTEFRAQNTAPGEIKGKHAYMAPEQVHGETLTRRADVFAAAIVLWEALTGDRLFRAESAAETMSRVLSSPIPGVSTYRKEIPKELDKLVRRGLDRRPEGRYDTALEFAQALEESSVPLVKHELLGEQVTSIFARSLEEKRELIRSTPMSSTSEIYVLKGGSRNNDFQGDSSLPTQRKGNGLKYVAAMALFLFVVGVVTWVAMQSVTDESTLSNERESIPSSTEDRDQNPSADNLRDPGALEPQKNASDTSDTESSEVSQERNPGDTSRRRVRRRGAVHSEKEHWPMRL